jgi:hypothetical protein
LIKLKIDNANCKNGFWTEFERENDSIVELSIDVKTNIIPSFMKFHKLRRLDIIEDVRQESISSLLDLLKSCQLDHFGFVFNHEATSKIFDTLIEKDCLTSLACYGTIDVIKRYLKKTEKLRSFKISCLWITLNEFLDIVDDNRTLTSLYIETSTLNNLRLIQFLKSNRRITSLTLRSIFDEELMKMIANAIQLNDTLTTFDLISPDDVDIDVDTSTMIRKKIRVNRQRMQNVEWVPRWGYFDVLIDPDKKRKRSEASFLKMLKLLY